MNNWSSRKKELVKKLNEEFRISHIDWHKNKGNKDRRAAELIVSGLSQLINNGDDSEIEELLTQAIKWIKQEIKDPGCPNH